LVHEGVKLSSLWTSGLHPPENIPSTHLL